MAVSPQIGFAGQVLRLVVSGVRSDLGPSPSVYFSIMATPGSPPPAQTVFVTAGSVRELGLGSYELEVRIADLAPRQDFTVVVTGTSGISDIAGSFRVLPQRLTTFPFLVPTVTPTLPLMPYSPLPSVTSLALSSAGSAAGTSGTGGAAASPPAASTQSGSGAGRTHAEKLLDARARIFAAEARLLEALADIAPSKLGDPDWLRAAAKKECCAAALIRALGDTLPATGAPAGASGAAGPFPARPPSPAVPSGTPASPARAQTFRFLGKVSSAGLAAFGFRAGGATHTVSLPGGTTAAAAVSRLAQHLAGAGVQASAVGGVLTATLPAGAVPLTGSGLVSVNVTGVAVDPDLGKTPFELRTCEKGNNGRPKDGPATVPALIQLLSPGDSGSDALEFVAGADRVLTVTTSRAGEPIQDVPVHLVALDGESHKATGAVSFRNGLAAETEGVAGTVVWTGPAGEATFELSFDTPGIYELGATVLEGRVEHHSNRPSTFLGVEIPGLLVGPVIAIVKRDPRRQTRKCRNYFTPTMDGLYADVDVASGTLIMKKKLMQIPARGLGGVELIITYSSDGASSGPLGPGWTHNYLQRFRPPLTFADGFGNTLSHGKDVTRPRGGPGDFSVTYFEHVDPNDLSSDLVVKRRYPGGTQEIYHHASGLIVSKQDNNGNAVRFFYDRINEHCVFKALVDCMGRVVARFSYELIPANDGSASTVPQVVAIADHVGRQISFDYNLIEGPNAPVGTLRAITTWAVNSTPDNAFPLGKTTLFRYLAPPPASDNPSASLRNNLVEVVNPNQVEDGTLAPTEIIKYGQLPTDRDFDRVRHQLGYTGSGTRQFDFVYTYTGPPDGEACTPRTVDVIDPERHRRTYYFDERGFKTAFETRTGFYDAGDPLLRPPLRGTAPETFRTEFEYTDDGQITRQQNPGGDEVRWTYQNLQSGDPLWDRLNANNAIRRVHKPGPAGGDQPELVEEFDFDPYFQRKVEERQPRRFESGDTRDLAFARRITYDWQRVMEQGEPAADYPSVEVTATGGTTSFKNVVRGGNPVETRTIVRIGHPGEQLIVTRRWYNRFGQLIREIDPEGNHTERHYNPEAWPDGRTATPPVPGISLDAATGGYLAAVVSDTRHEAGANQPDAAFPLPDPAVMPRTLRTDYAYDAAGNNVRQTDPRGVVTIFRYNERNRIVEEVHGKEIDPARGEPGLMPVPGVRTRFFFDANDNVVQINRAAPPSIPDLHGPSPFPFSHSGSVVEFREYNRENELIATTRSRDASGVVRTERVLNGNNLCVEERTGEAVAGRQPEARLLRTYDERDLLIEVTRGGHGPNLSTKRLYYDANGSKVREESGEGRRTFLVRDGFNRIIETIDDMGGVNRTRLDAAGNIVHTEELGLLRDDGTRPRLADNLGNRAAALAGNIVLMRTEHVFDELNRLVETRDHFFIVDTAGVETPITRDGNGDGIALTLKSYDRLGRTLRVQDDNGVTTFYAFDGLGQERMRVDGAGNIRERTLDGGNNVVQSSARDVTTPGGTLAAPITTRYRYDALGRKVETLDPLGNASFIRYDSLGNRVEDRDAEGNVIRLQYDALGRRTRREVVMTGDGTGRTSLEPAQGGGDGLQTIRYQYDDNDRLVKLIDDAGNVTAFRYDALGRRIEERFTDSTRVIFQHDRDDNRVRRVDATGTVVTNVFDRAGRRTLTEAKYPTSAGFALQGTIAVRTVYDGMGRVVETTDVLDTGGSSLVMSTYDSLGNTTRQIQTLDGDAFELITEHDGVGNPVKRAYFSRPGQAAPTTLIYGYDGLNRVQSVDEAGGGAVARISFRGDRVQMLEGANGSVLRCTFDGKRRIVRHHVKAAGAEVVDYELTYNRMDGLVSERRRHDGDAGVAYHYDSAYQLVGIRRGPVVAGKVHAPVARRKYVLDGVGNRTAVHDVPGSGAGGGSGAPGASSTSYVVNALNQYISIGPSVLRYSPAGNLAEDADLEYAYDALNRLSAVRRKGGSERLVVYRYDGLGRRVAKTVNPDGDASTLTRFLYAGAAVLEERDNGGALLRGYVQLPRADLPVELRTTSGERYTYHFDARRNVIALTDAAGAVVERYDYDEFGRIAVTDGAGIRRAMSIFGNPYQFSGRELDEETGCCHFRGRTYVPTLGRFAQRDPVGRDEKPNLYTYASNNPVNRHDPFGLQDTATLGEDEQLKEDKVTKQLEIQVYTGDEDELPKGRSTGVAVLSVGTRMRVAGPVTATVNVRTGIANKSLGQGVQGAIHRAIGSTPTEEKFTNPLPDGGVGGVRVTARAKARVGVMRGDLTVSAEAGTEAVRAGASVGVSGEVGNTTISGRLGATFNGHSDLNPDPEPVVLRGSVSVAGRPGTSLLGLVPSPGTDSTSVDLLREVRVTGHSSQYEDTRTPQIHFDAEVIGVNTDVGRVSFGLNNDLPGGTDFGATGGGYLRWEAPRSSGFTIGGFGFVEEGGGGGGGFQLGWRF